MDQSFGNLIKLHEMGILTKEELRKKFYSGTHLVLLATSPIPSRFVVTTTPPAVMTTKNNLYNISIKKRGAPQAENILNPDNSDVNVTPLECKKKEA